MGFRFRRSFKVAPGVRINLGKKSGSVSFGTKGARYTINTKGKRTASVGIPGTGLYYTTTLGGSKKKTSRSSSSKTYQVILPASEQVNYKARPAPAAPWYRSYAGCWIMGVIGIVLGLAGVSSAGWMLLFAVAGIACIILGFKGRKIARNTPVENDVWTNQPIIPLEELQEELCPGGDWKKLVAAARLGLPQWARIFTESMDLMQDTLSTDTFFSRYQLAQDMMKKLSAASCVLVVPNFQPRGFSDQFVEETEPLILDFIERSRQDMLLKASMLKTENGRRNRCVKYYQSLLPFADHITGRAQDALVSFMCEDGIDEEDLNK